MLLGWRQKHSCPNLACIPCMWGGQEGVLLGSLYKRAMYKHLVLKSKGKVVKKGSAHAMCRKN